MKLWNATYVRMYVYHLQLTYLVRRKYREEADRRVRELDEDFEQAIQETETRVRSKVSNHGNRTGMV